MRRDVEKVKAGLKKKTSAVKRRPEPCDLLSTGSTLLNLACTDDWRGGFSKGKYFLVVGDSASGKTFLSLTCLAEASINPAFDAYRFVYDDVEGGALMDIENLFGPRVMSRLEPPGIADGIPIYSQTVDEFYFHLDDVLNTGPCIYILDSMDALTSEQEQDKFQERKKAARKGKQMPGSFGDGKAKTNSASLRACLAKLRDTGSILIFVNQTRDNIGAGLFQPKKTRSGGRALTFYATLEIWSSIAKRIKKTAHGEERVQGIQSRVQVKKNRFTGKERTVEIPIYVDLGIDDIGSCVDYLITERRWSCSKEGLIDTKGDLPDVPAAMKRMELIRVIEDNRLKLELVLRELVGRIWHEVEAAFKEQRKPRYT